MTNPDNSHTPSIWWRLQDALESGGSVTIIDMNTLVTTIGWLNEHGGAYIMTANPLNETWMLEISPSPETRQVQRDPEAEALARFQHLVRIGDGWYQHVEFERPVPIFVRYIDILETSGRFEKDIPRGRQRDIPWHLPLGHPDRPIAWRKSQKIY